MLYRFATTKKLNAIAAPRRATTVVASNSKSTVSSFGFTEGDPSSLSEGGLIFGACMEVVAVRGIVEPCDDSIAGLSGFGNAGAMTNETANDGSMARARTAKPFIIILVASRVRARVRLPSSSRDSRARKRRTCVTERPLHLPAREKLEKRPAPWTAVT